MSDTASYCGICSLRSINTPSAVRCSECDEDFCTECREHHRLSKLSRHHVTVPIEEYLNLPLCIKEIILFCEKHEQKYQIFCKKHDSLCCNKCVVESHNACGELALLDDVIRNTKSSSVFEDLKIRLKHDLTNLQQFIQDRHTNVKMVSEARERIGTSIEDFRKKMNAHLDELQANLESELTEEAEKAQSQIEDMMSLLKDKETEVNKRMTVIENIDKYASDLQAFIGMKLIEQAQQKTRCLLRSPDFKENFKELELSCKINSFVSDFPSYLNNFGQVNLGSKAISHMTFFGLEATLQAKVDPREYSSLFNENTSALRDVRGCRVLSNQNLVFCRENSENLLVLPVDGSESFSIELTFKLNGSVTIIDENILAVSIGREGISIVDIEQSVEKEYIKTGFCSQGLAFFDGNLICCQQNRGLHFFNIKSHLIDNFIQCPLPGYANIAVFGENICYTNKNTHSVTCCDMKGKIIWKFNDKCLSKPMGITIDENTGNIFVAGYGSSNVVVISADGKQFKEILMHQNEVSSPTCLHYNSSTRQLLVANQNRYAFVYKILD